MKRREFFFAAGCVGGLTVRPRVGASLFLAQTALGQPKKILGMYIHSGWHYKRPYAARMWTLEDWRGYADGLSKVGYNTLLIFPYIETMPSVLTPSDQANLERMAKVMDMLHGFAFQAYVVL